MPLNKLTDLKVRTARLAPGKVEQYLGDGGGLYLRLRADGKNWQFIATLNKKQVKVGLGTYPSVSLADARTEAQRCRELVRQGINPSEHKAETAAQATQKAAATAQVLTVERLFETWLEMEAKHRKDGGHEVTRAFKKDVLPLIGSMPADGVRRADIMTVLDQVMQRGAKRIANQLLQNLRQMFMFAVIRELVPTDPTAGITKKLAGGKEEPRERTLSTAELKELADKLPQSGLAPHAEAAVLVMLSTCCRVGEISGARWSDVNLTNGTWTIPAENSKNGHPHLIHLSPFAITQFERLASVARSDVWVIPGRDPARHLDKKALQRQIHDRQRSARLNGRSNQLCALSLSGGEWRSHDLRRTAATLMGELCIRSDVIERCLGHLPDNRLMKVYQRQELMSERREAFATLGQKLSELFSATDRH
ncbi:MAG: tyrosine-type recombinase/integrase [Nevskia sp.]|nr:tyrosine-type recombinase/integrase [Nevskia sp.]